VRRNLVAGVALTLLAGGMAVVGAPGAAFAADDYTGLINYKSRYYMVKTSTNYVIQDSVDSQSGYWMRIHLSNGNYQFMNLANKGGLGIDGAKTTSGAAAYVGTYSSTATNQQWTFPKTNVPRTGETGWAMIKNVKSGLCLGVASGSTSAGAAIAQYACNASAPNQAWAMNDPGV